MCKPPPPPLPSALNCISPALPCPAAPRLEPQRKFARYIARATSDPCFVDDFRTSLAAFKAECSKADAAAGAVQARIGSFR